MRGPDPTTNMAMLISTSTPRVAQIQYWPHQLPIKPAAIPAASNTSREAFATAAEPLERSSRARIRSISRSPRSLKATAPAAPWANRKPKTPRTCVKTSHLYINLTPWQQRTTTPLGTNSDRTSVLPPLPRLVVTLPTLNPMSGRGAQRWGLGVRSISGLTASPYIVLPLFTYEYRPPAPLEPSYTCWTGPVSPVD